MTPSRREWRRYLKAEERFRESVKARADSNPEHTYPARENDLSVMYHYHNAHGIPARGFRAWLKRWVSWLTPGGGGE